MNQRERGFSVALAAAELSDAKRAGLRMGAALFDGSRLLSIGANQYAKTHTGAENSKHFCRNLHAEHSAILKRRHYGVSGLTLYVARRRADGSLGCSKPCANCLSLCRVSGVKKVVYTDISGAQKEIIL